MGVGTILEARKIVIMAFGEHKAPIVLRAIEGEMTEAIAASFLQKHADTTFMLDQAAAGYSDRRSPCPGRVGLRQLDSDPDTAGRDLAQSRRSTRGSSSCPTTTFASTSFTSCCASMGRRTAWAGVSSTK